MHFTSDWIITEFIIPRAILGPRMKRKYPSPVLKSETDISSQAHRSEIISYHDYWNFIALRN